MKKQTALSIYHILGVTLVMISFSTKQTTQQNGEMEALQNKILSESMELTATTDSESKKIFTNDTVTVLCNLRRDCKREDEALCTNRNTLQWFLPNSLAADRQESRIGMDMRIESHKEAQDGQVVRIEMIARMTFRQIGFQHEGSYQCSGVKRRGRFQLIINENHGKHCYYPDQCKSLNCYNRKCQCPSVDQNFIPETFVCVTKKRLKEQCKYSSECAPKRMLTLERFLEREDNIECTNGICSCATNTTSVYVAFPSKTNLCLASNLPLGGECLDKKQCSTHGSYCGLNDDLKSVCKCREGWRQMNDKCMQVQSCNSTLLGFNENLIGGYGCGDNQFCRNDVCLCSPKFTYNDFGECVQLIPIKEEQFLKRYGFLMLLAISSVVVIISIIALTHFVVDKCKRPQQPPNPFEAFSVKRHRR